MVPRWGFRPTVGPKAGPGALTPQALGLTINSRGPGLGGLLLF
jgi:hypothetical protein